MAARSRSAKRAARRALGTERPPKTAPIALEEVHLTEEQWALVGPLLPPQGARREGHPTTTAPFWAASCGWRGRARRGGSCRRSTASGRAYRRHELWVKQGLWERILRALGEEDLPGPATKEPK